jgi:hypothetical protein
MRALILLVVMAASTSLENKNSYWHFGAGAAREFGNE